MATRAYINEYWGHRLGIDFRHSTTDFNYKEDDKLMQLHTSPNLGTITKNMVQKVMPSMSLSLDFTPEQHQAIFTFDQNLMVTAGAGSGKTRVLVERYLALLDHHQDWELAQIVAITFTEKAAREMRDRVRLAINQKMKVNPQRWQRYEAALDSARISTIHALCGQILRSNPVEARLDPAFEVLDEVEARLYKREAVEQTLNNLVKSNGPAVTLLLQYPIQSIRTVLLNFASRATTFSANPTNLKTEWSTWWEKDTRQILSRIHQDEMLKEALQWPDYYEGNPPHSDKMWANWEIVLANRELLFSADSSDVFGGFQNLLAMNFQGGSAKSWGGKDVFEACKSALKTIREKAEHYLKAILPPLNEVDERALELLPLWEMAIREVQATYEQFKSQTDLLDFDDLEQLTLQLLRDYPHVAARYAHPDHGEFKHIMVDEFQDTNDAQRQIIYALCGIQPNASTSAQGKLFVVGDPKQSIYAFRGADVSVFGDVQQDLLRSGGVEFTLSTSFRTHQRLVAMNNHLFGHILQPTAGPTAPYTVGLGKPMKATRPSAEHHQTPVTLLLMQRPESDDKDKRWNSQKMHEWEALEIATQIHRMVKRQTPIWDKGQQKYRPMHYGDITLLFRSRTHMPRYESVFQTQEIPYITVGGIGYYEQQEVWDLMNLLRVLHNPMDNLALASILRSPMFGVSDEGLYVLRSVEQDNQPLPLWDMLLAETPSIEALPLSEHDKTPLANAQYVLQMLHGLAGRITIAELLTQALELTAYEATLMALPNGARRQANITKLLSIARRSGRVSLSEFNAYLNDIQASEARESEAPIEVEGVVTLMTVHASKGLEFPVVIVPDASWMRRNNERPYLIVDPLIGPICRVPNPDTEDDEAFVEPFAYQLAQKYQEEREAAELKRLFYVAATRAQDYLVMSGQVVKGEHWLYQFCEALQVNIEDLPPTTTPHSINYEWGNLEIVVPVPQPDFEHTTQFESPSELWEQLSIKSANATPHLLPTTLPLLAPIPSINVRSVRHINATQLEKLGQASYERPEYAGYASFRSMLLHDQPRPIPNIIPLGEERPVPRRIVGDIVHRILKIGIGIDHPQLDALLASYAWDRGITDEGQRQQALAMARELLEQYNRSEIPSFLANADQVYREIEFVYERGKYIIHGIIDVLYYYKDQWYVLDYKTASVSADYVAWHAKRYRYQLGAYAAAVEERIGQIPKVWLYYLHSGKKYEITQETWEAALKGLDSEIEHALRQSDLTQNKFATGEFSRTMERTSSPESGVE